MTRRETPLDAAAILRALADHGVDYVVIGGMAVQAHGHTRTTQDLDLVPEPSAVNLARLAAAAHALGVTADIDFRESIAITLETSAGGLDVHLRPPGAAPYARLRARALELDVAGLKVAVAGLDDLIAMKRASGRPIDRGDVIALTQADQPA